MSRHLPQKKMSACLLQLIILSLLGFVHANGQKIKQKKGVDSSVVYESFKNFSPWDDRNYELTAEDISLLAANEDELTDPIPTFFRVMLRRAYPNLPTTGAAQYPRSALQIYLSMYEGYQVRGKTFKYLEFEEGNYEVRRKDANEKADKQVELLLNEEIRITKPPASDECAIKINPANPNHIIAGTNGPGYQTGMHFSSDGGKTWTMTDLPLGNTLCDPTVDWSSDGRFAYAATLGKSGPTGCPVWFYRSADNGQTWTDLQTIPPAIPRREITNGGSDKEFLHVDKYPMSPFRDNIYMTWQEGNIMQFGRSTDFGNTWAKTSFLNDPRGVGSDIVTDKKGYIYYLYPSTESRKIVLKKSTDGGISFQQGTVTVADTKGDYDFPIPSQETRKAWIYVSAEADLSNGPYGGSIYAAWTDTYDPDSENNSRYNHTRVQTAYSRDGGISWTVVTPHSIEDKDNVDRWNQWLAVGENGTVYLIFYDTRNSANRSGVDLYFCFSTDGGQTYSAPERLTSQTSSNLSDSQEFGDYNGLDYVINQIAIYVDNRKASGTRGDSKSVYSIIRK